MTVSELFEKEKIDGYFIQQHMLPDFPYWAKVHNFMSAVWDDELDGFNTKERAALTQILERCVEFRAETK